MSSPSRGQVISGLLTVTALAAIVAALRLLGPPSEERARRLDERRVQDLTAISASVDLYWTRHTALPRSIDDLRPESTVNVRWADPATNGSYEYRPLDAHRYELCAAFDRDSRDSNPQVTTFWSHHAGRQCFQREAQKMR